MTVAAKPRSSRKTPNPQSETGKPVEIDSNNTPSPDREAMVAEAAFYIAEARGFAPGQEIDDWLAAERMLGHQPG